MQTTSLNHRQLYRLPWTLPDNAISWLEPTSACNLSCYGCYRENIPSAHKSLAEIEKEIDTFVALRRSDCISIAGGDPLLHPHIVEIVGRIKARGFKPIINTNGLALTKELLRELKKAGVAGFTFHIDSKQNRPKWKHKNEVELNALRLQYAEMLAEVGGISCAFNATVYEDTLPYVPDIVAWAAKHIDIVHVVVFIAFRQAVPSLPVDFYVRDKKIDMGVLTYSSTEQPKVDLLATDIVQTIRERFPDFAPCAYLNGTEKPDAFKWLLSIRVGTKERIYGYLGSKFIELMQTQYHFWKGRYLSYTAPALLKLGKSVLLFSPLDHGARQAAARYLGALCTRPWRLLQRMYFQSMMIIQPVDIMTDGGLNMCDGCPDVTVWDGKLVWSCRLEELKHFGGFVHTVPKGDYMGEEEHRG